MKWLNIIGGLAGAVIAPTATIASVVTAAEYHGLSRMSRSQWLAFGPSAGVLALALIIATLAALRRESGKRFRKPRDWGHVTGFPGIHRFALKMKWDHTQRASRHKDRITAYMARILDGASDATIFSRDLSWATDPRAASSLDRLASDGNLTIYVHQPKSRILSDRVDSLVRQGANVLAYTHPDHPKVRFTRVRSSGTTMLAVGKEDKRHHRIKEFRDEDELTFQMANCLTSIDKVWRIRGTGDRAIGSQEA